jgi:SWI/SNF-related matrix-associated actin-dependent regulator of chromatin subfamily A3
MYTYTSFDHLLHSLSTGIRYYRGVAHPGEYVTLVREPSNPYDRNAIRVDNMRGEKVGHIKRELAAVLSPVMASHGDRLKVDATIPGPGNQFELPLTLHLYSSTPSDGSIETKLACLAANPKAALKRAAAAVAAVPPQLSASSPAVVVQARTMDWKLQQKHLDELFEAQRQEQLANLPALEVPRCLVSALLEHQWTGVRWLVSREKSTDRPFWKTVTENGSTKWLCEVTKSSQPQPPRQVKGSILADDMGLVRLQTSLVLAGIARVALTLTIRPVPGTLSNLFRGRRFKRSRSSSLILPQGETTTLQSSHRRLRLERTMRRMVNRIPRSLP